MGQLAIASSVLQAGGQIMGGISEKGAANAQARIAKQNAEVAARNAELTMQAGENDAFALGLKNRAQMGAIKAEQAASGLDLSSGSAEAVRDSQAALGLYDAMQTRSNAAREAFGYKVKETDLKNEARLARNRGNAAMIGAALGAASSLAGGVSDYTKMSNQSADVKARLD